MRRGLYAIVDLDSLSRRDALRFAGQLLDAAPLAALQLRAKHHSAHVVLRLGQALAERCRRYAVPFFVNDRADIAATTGAEGVHLGQADLSAADARALFPTLSLGLSTHDRVQFARAREQPLDYIAYGPIFRTNSKMNPDAVVGAEGLRQVCAASEPSIPVVAIGGITRENASRIAEAGATAGAVIAELVRANDSDVTKAARALHVALGGAL